MKNKRSEILKRFQIIIISSLILFILSACNQTPEENNENNKKDDTTDYSQLGLEIIWVDTDITDFIIYGDYKTDDGRYVVTYNNDGLMYNFVVDIATGGIIKTAPYDGIGQFYEGRAVVKYCDRKIVNEGRGYTAENFRRGYIDIEGNEIIPTIYTDASYFSEGLAYVQKSSKYAYIDYEGNVVLPFEYTKAQPFDGGYASVSKLDKNGNEISGIIDKKGKFSEVKGAIAISKFNNGIARAWNDYEEYFIDTKGNTIKNVNKKPEILKQYFESRDFKEDRAVVAKQNNELRLKYGVIDKDGNEIIPCEYTYIYDYNNGMTSALLATDSYAYFDIDGKKITPFKYNITNDFNEGAAIVRSVETNKYGAINKYGNEIVPPIFKRISNFDNGSALVLSDNNKLGILKLPESLNSDDGSTEIIRVVFNGEEIVFDQDPIMFSNSVMIPISAIFQKMDAELIWNEGKVTIALNDKKIELQKEMYEAVINGETFTMDAPVKLIGGRVLVPASFFKHLGYEIKWEKDTKTVIISAI